MSNLDKAREWAKRWEDGSEENDPFIDSEELAAIKLVKSLPDQWIDVEKVREIIDEMRHPGTHLKMTDFERGAENMTEAWRKRLESVLTPKLPTLADMTEGEREACQWMQCKIEGFDKNLFIISTGSRRSKAVGRDGYDVACINSDITPLPDLPKLQWPGSELAETPALPEGMRLADHPDFGRVVVSPWADDYEEYRVFYRDEDMNAGADSYYVKKSNLNFLDGGE